MSVRKRQPHATGGDEGWSVIEVICHLRDAEEISLQRMQAMRDQANPTITGYDQEALARDRDYKSQDLRLALEGFNHYRSQYVAALSALTLAEWDRPGQHSELGQITIMAHTIHHTCHDAIHCAQIATQLARHA